MSEYIKLWINNTEIKAKDGSNLLWTALDNGFYIPNLCSIKGYNWTNASCRLCFVEIKGFDSPLTSCTQSVHDGMQVYLNTSKVQRLRSTALELLLSHHNLNCINCKRNGNCELQNIAHHLKMPLKLKTLRPIERTLPVDISHPLFIYDPNRCVLCGKCIEVCYRNGKGLLNFSNRGINTIMSTFYNTPLSQSGCDNCLECVKICPVASLLLK